MKRVLVFWSWNYKMDEDTILSTLDGYKKAGIEGFFIHARAGLMTEYFGDEWFKLIRFTAKEASKRGLATYLYDENGWPSGFADGKVPALGKDYQQAYVEKKTLKGKEVKKLETAAIYYLDKLISLDKVKDSRTYTAFVIGRNPSYTDLLSKDAIKKFIEFSHEVYKEKLGDMFGKEILGIFTDEPQLSTVGYPYSPVLFDTFEKEYGYSLKKVFVNIDKPGFEELRLDYRAHLDKLMKEAFFGQIGKWCEENGLIFTGHSAAEDGPYSQIQSQCDVMTSYEHFQMPGIDFLTNRYTPITLIKQVSSVAGQFGRKNVLSETFGGAGHSATPKELLSKWFYQCMFGINVACIHLSATSQTGRRKRDYPPTFSYHLNWFREMPYFTGAMKKMAECAVGKTQANVLVINPITSYFTGYRPGGEFIDPRLSAISTHYRMLLETLAEIGIGFDIGDEFIMKKYARIEDGKIFVGDKKYSAVIIPDCDNLMGSTLDLIEKSAALGGKVFVTENAPYLIDGKRNEKVKKLFEGGIVQGLCVRSAAIRRTLKEHGIETRVTISDGGGKNAKNCLINVIEAGKGDRVFIKNTVDERRKLTVKYLGNVYEVELEGLSGAIIDTGDRNVYYPIENRTVSLHGEKEEISRRVIDVRFSEKRTENVAVIDKCAVYLKDEKIAEGYTLFCNEKLYSVLPEGKRTPIRVEYKIRSDIEKKVKAVIEKSADITDVVINDKRCFLSDEWFYDKDFKTTEFKLVSGVNKISVTYSLKGKSALGMEFETERNKYFRTTEIENVYILGDFNVEPENISYAKRLGKEYLIFDGYTIKSNDGKGGDIVKPFFRGKTEIETVFNYVPEENTEVYLSLDNSYPVARISLNRTDVGATFGKSPVKVTGALKSGRNKLKVTLYSSDRNLIGPMHYVGHDTELIGPETFAGENGFSLSFDVETPPSLLPDNVYSDEYHCLIEKYENKIIITEKK